MFYNYILCVHTMYVTFCVCSINYGCMSRSYLMFVGYGQLLVLDESLTVLFVLADIVEIACV